MITLILGPKKSGKKYLATALAQQKKRVAVIDLREYINFPELECINWAKQEELTSALSKKKTEIIMYANAFGDSAVADSHLLVRFLETLVSGLSINKVVHLYKVSFTKRKG